MGKVERDLRSCLDWLWTWYWEAAFAAKASGSGWESLIEKANTYNFGGINFTKAFFVIKGRSGIYALWRLELSMHQS